MTSLRSSKCPRSRSRRGVEVVKTVVQERISERICEQGVFVEESKISSQDRVLQRAMEQTLDESWVRRLRPRLSVADRRGAGRKLSLKVTRRRGAGRRLSLWVMRRRCTMSCTAGTDSRAYAMDAT